MRSVPAVLRPAQPGYLSNERDLAVFSLSTTNYGQVTGMMDEETKSMIDYIRNAVFKTTRLSAGYVVQEVDAFLDDATERIRRGESVPMPPRFSQVRLRPGYVKEDVDALIAEVMRFRPPFR